MIRAFVAAVAVAFMATALGCTSKPNSSGAVAQAAPVGFVQSETVDGIPVKLSVEPFKPGSNTFVVLTQETGITAVETQVIMLEMGHGEILDMPPTAAGRYEVTSPAINMEGKWMLRVKLTTTSGEEKLATFYGKIPPPQ
ncbi:MAG: hypothetical protein ACOY94_00215 [Bacillota bacterium]